ncbi:ammonium transporter [Azospirillum sp.]|uniref:ammonium transporter n=1 Tax=Azospirillum sp. TaxID=34012 RepID=UPI003D73BFC4
MELRLIGKAAPAGLIGALATALPAMAADAPAPALAPSGANTAWILVASALVLFMTLPGLALFYGGLVRARNVLSVLMNCFAICCVASLIWVTFGYSLAFDGTAPYLGGLGKTFLANMDAAMPASGLPENVFALFQMTFAIITPALIIGAFPERAPFAFVVVFSTVWLVLVYLPAAHWLWGGGWLAAMGALDFAGGIVVHTTAGVSALVAAVMIGRRKGFPHELIPPHSPAMTMTGAGILWVGWFGFNGGSALAADQSAAAAIIATHVAASAGALTWTAIEWLKLGKPTSVGLVTGCVAGLATVTPAAGYIGPGGAIVLGALGGAVCFQCVLYVKQRLLIDDSLDVFAVHGVGGMLGSLLLAVFALKGLGGNGLAEGMTWLGQLGVQALAVGVTALWSGAVTWAIIKAVNVAIARRVSAEEEYEGLDLSTHGERAYEIS